MSCIFFKFSDNYIKNPLEQFDLLHFIRCSFNGLYSILNISYTFLTVMLIIYIGLKTYKNGPLVLSFFLKSIYKLVQDIINKNLYLNKQIYLVNYLYLFIFILISNLVGLLPFSYTITSSFILTLFLSLSYFIAINIVLIIRNGWNSILIFLPNGIPYAILPFLFLIEILSYFSRLISLSIRLFANMMSGHALLKILITFAWTLVTGGSIFIIVSIVPWLVVTAVLFLEVLIACLQAYVFVTLLILYMNQSYTGH